MELEDYYETEEEETGAETDEALMEEAKKLWWELRRLPRAEVIARLEEIEDILEYKGYLVSETDSGLEFTHSD